MAVRRMRLLGPEEDEARDPQPTTTRGLCQAAEVGAPGDRLSTDAGRAGGTAGERQVPRPQGNVQAEDGSAEAA